MSGEAVDMNGAVEDLNVRRFERLYDALDAALDADDIDGVEAVMAARAEVLGVLGAVYGPDNPLPVAVAERITHRERRARARIAAVRDAARAELDGQQRRASAVRAYAKDL